MKAGLFDRAEAAWHALEGTPFDGRRSWRCCRCTNAAATGARRGQWRGSSTRPARLVRPRIGALRMRMAEEADAQGRPMTPWPRWRARGRTRRRAPRRADRAAPAAARDSRRCAGRPGTPARSNPGAFLLVAADYAACRAACGQAEADAQQVLAAGLRTLPAVELLQALEQVDAANAPQRLPRLLAHLQQHPSLSAAQLLLAVPHALWTEPPGRPCAKPWRAPPSHCSATAARPAASRPSTTSGNARAASAGTATRRSASTRCSRRAACPAGAPRGRTGQGHAAASCFSNSASTSAARRHLALAADAGHRPGPVMPARPGSWSQ
jgi:hypothetical protein